MNKKQLMVAWVMGIIITIILLYCSDWRIDKLIHPAFILTWFVYTLVILIFGGLLIYTLRDKKK